MPDRNTHAATEVEEVRRDVDAAAAYTHPAMKGVVRMRRMRMRMMILSGNRDGDEIGVTNNGNSHIMTLSHTILCGSTIHFCEVFSRVTVWRGDGSDTQAVTVIARA